MELSNRKNLRLRNYDYSTDGGYFVTICTERRRCSLSHIEPGTHITRANVRLSKLGQIAKEELHKLESRYHIRVNSYVIMPNHIHMIIFLDKTNEPKPLGQIIGAYKSLVAKQWREYGNSNGFTTGTLWQRNYYEHVLRNHSDYLEKLQYIDENPDKWAQDDEYVL